MEKKHSCIYSRSMNQPYPRLCLKCGKQESRPLSNLEERFKQEMSMIVMPLDNQNIPEEKLVEIAKSSAFEFRVDYKPFETDLNYREYAEYGFEKGFIEGTKWMTENTNGYLQRFIDQFGDGILGELDPKEWDALQFLEWLKLNNYEIIKKK